MRIIAGSMGGRQFDAPKGHKTHPMSEKMRGALFNILGDIENLTVFDAYGGSGALAYEAISRGAKEVTVAEIDREAIRVIEQNIRQLNLYGQVKLVRQNSANWAENNPGEQFNLVLCDPPYNDIRQSQLTKVSQSVKPSGLLVLSMPPTAERFVFDGFIIEADKNYGDASLVIYRRIA